jgi:sulfur carrier protein ThiS adenylyltransferase
MRTGFNFSEVIENYYNSDQIKKIQSIKIGIAGAGGIGSNCVILLIRSGFLAIYYCRF